LIYKLKSGARLSVGAQVAGEECARLEAAGRLTPHNLVEESRPEDAPLHKCFEWDDSVAAEKWRETQAAYIIRSVEVTVEKSNEPTRAFVVTVSDDKREYQSIGYVLRDTSSREYLLEQAKRELTSFRRKYQNLFELSQVFEAIDGIAGSQTALQLEAS
jgi:hypothetical protein